MSSVYYPELWLGGRRMKTTTVLITEEQYAWIKERSLNFSHFVRTMLTETMELEELAKQIDSKKLREDKLLEKFLDEKEKKKR